MASAFDKLRNKADSMKKLSDKIETERNAYDDSRFWKLTVDKRQTGSAVIRFLPAADGEEYPYVKLYEHAFEWPHKGSGQWFVENCPTTIEREDCPCCEANNEEWAKGTDKAKDVARYRKRNLSYIANILVVDDTAKPENNGKVFLFKFGARIFQKIEGALKPEFADITAINPFDLWEGANFKLRARELDGQRSYDMSVFDACGPAITHADGTPDDGAMEKMWNSQYKLNDEIASSKFKSPTDLQARWNKIMGVKAPAGESARAQLEGGTDTGSTFQRRSAGNAQQQDPAAAPVQQSSQTQVDPAAGRDETQDIPWEDRKDPAAATPPPPAPAASPRPPAPAASPRPPAPAPAATPVAAPPAGGSLADKYRSMLKK